MKFSEFSESCSRAQVAILGPGGSGKTTLVYSASQHGKTLAIESEEGAHVARDVVNADNLEIETVSKKVKKNGRWVSLPLEEQPPIRDRVEELVSLAYSGDYDIVLVDSLSDVAGHFEDEYARKTGNVSQNDWYKIIEGMKTFVRRLREGPFHLICTCIAAPPREGSLIEISPSLPGQLRDQMLPMFQSVLLMGYDKTTGTRTLVVDDPGRGVRDRFHSFSVPVVPVVGDPSWIIGKLIEGAKGKKKEGKDAPKAEKKKSVARTVYRR